MNQLQLLILLLLLDIYLPLKVVNYLRSLASALVNIDINWEFFIVFRKIIAWFDYPQDQDDLYIINLESGSSVINLNTFLTLMLCFILSSTVISLLLLCQKKSKRLITRLLRYLHKSLNFEMYIRLIFECFIILCL